MTDDTRICCICRRSDRTKFNEVHKRDTDKISFMDKLKKLISPAELVLLDNMEMCSSCVKSLRISYRFMETVLGAQELLKQQQRTRTAKGELEASSVKSEMFEDILVDSFLLVKDEFVDEDEDEEFQDVSLGDIKKNKQPANQGKTSPIGQKMCPQCGVEFAKRWQLKKHLAMVHNPERRFHCSYCEKGFKQAFHLKEHMTAHTGEKKYDCSICGKKFQRMSSQRRHSKSHGAAQGEKTKKTPFLCTICGKNFPFSNGVQRHMRVHLGIKNFQCTICARRFTQSTHLHVHMRTHTGEKPYTCDTCGEKFSLKSCMLKHINSKHHQKTKNHAVELPVFYLESQFGDVVKTSYFS